MSDRWAIVPLNQRERRWWVAEWLVWRWRQVAAEEGVQVAARRLRKSGVPILVALRILGVQPTAVPRPLSGRPALPARRD